MEKVARAILHQPHAAPAFNPGPAQMNTQQIAHLRSLIANNAAAVAQRRANTAAAVEQAQRQATMASLRQAAPSQQQSAGGLRSFERLAQEADERLPSLEQQKGQAA